MSKAAVTSSFDAATDAAKRAAALPRAVKPRISLPMAEKYSVRKDVLPISLDQVSTNMVQNIDGILTDIMVEASLSSDNQEDVTNFLNAIVADIYVNSSSDKRDFTGSICFNGFELERRHIETVIRRHCNNNYRRFTRSMAKTVIEVMTDNPIFSELLSKRADQLNITPAEAIKMFDGADGAIIGRSAEVKLASLKASKLKDSDKATAGNSTGKDSALFISNAIGAEEDE
jgi:hypothetical protein